MTEEQATLIAEPWGNSRQSRILQAMIVLALVTAVYWPILSAMVWHWEIVPDYSHGFLVVPLALYFAYEKKYDLADAPIVGDWRGLALMALGVAVLAVGQLGGLLMPLRASYVVSLMGITLLFMGREVFRILLFPMVFLFLMIPLPQSLVNVAAFPLQLIAAQWAVWVLQALSIPVLLEGNIIHLAHSDLFVAEACSGLRSLMALLTLGVVFAHFFRPKQFVQQAILILSTIPIAVIVNSFRVAITGILTQYYGEEAAGGFIHEFQGMITFSLAFIVLLAEARLLGFAASRLKEAKTA